MTKKPTFQQGPVDTHFFASSAAEWRVDNDPAALIAYMTKQGYPFNVYMVPLPKDENYRIEAYTPVVDGTQFLAFYGFEE